MDNIKTENYFKTISRAKVRVSHGSSITKKLLQSRKQESELSSFLFFLSINKIYINLKKEFPWISASDGDPWKFYFN